jgi:localization factor PodJL
MARPIPTTDSSEPHDQESTEWQALRGELVDLLDQVETRYSRLEQPPGDDYDGLSRRVRDLRSQVTEAPGGTRRREALQSVKRAVDRFSEKDEPVRTEEPDELRAAIAEIRNRQTGQANPLGRRASDGAQYAEFTGLVGGLSRRLEGLETELRSQRTNTSHVRGVAGQVEQLTQVVELLAGAVGETGQVKRLEAQIGALARIVEAAPEPDLSVLNARLDEVSLTVGKLAELQAAQMEREVVRDNRPAKSDPAIGPAMSAIEAGVRNVYDRIDAIERTTSISQGDLERLTSELADFTAAMQDRQSSSDTLVGKLDQLAARVAAFDAQGSDILDLRKDVGALRESLASALEPRFTRIESRIVALGDKLDQAPAVSVDGIERQLQLLADRMDETGAHLAALAEYSAAQANNPPMVDTESVADAVSRRIEDTLARFQSSAVDQGELNALEKRLTGLLGGLATGGADASEIADLVSERVTPRIEAARAGGADDGRLTAIEERLRAIGTEPAQGPDADAIAEIVAKRTTDALGRSMPAATGFDGDAFEKRMSAIVATAGKETAERLARLEATLTRPTTAEPVTDEPAPDATPVATASTATLSNAADVSAFEDDIDAETLEPAAASSTDQRLDAMLASLSSGAKDELDPGRDRMPKDPSEDAPLVDPGFPAPQADTAMAKPTPELEPDDRPAFDPETIARPPKPVSSLAEVRQDPFAAPVATVAPTAPEAVSVPLTSQSTFIAAARRAQREKVTAGSEAGTGSLIGRALQRVRPKDEAAPVAPAPEAEPESAPAKRKLWQRQPKSDAVAPAAQPVAPQPAQSADDEPARESFLTRHRRPILLAAALVAVSALALNLAMQRGGGTPAPRQQAPASETVEPETPVETTGSLTTEPTPELSAPASTAATLLEAPEAGALIDSISTGSVDQMSTRSFTTRQQSPLEIPAELSSAPAEPDEDVADLPPLEPSTDTEVAASPIALDLPPDALGPEALRSAAASGDPRAQFEIAAIYTEGLAIEQDLEAAAVWYERSAAQGFVPAQYRLANLYEAGSGVEKDLAEAKIWYQRAAEAGHRMAMHNLAAILAGGELGEQEFEAAAEWFGQAAERGMTDSQFNLGMLHARGLGVEQDLEASYRWFSLAALRGDEDAANARTDIARSLSAEAVSRIDAEVATWTPEGIDLAANFAPIGTWSESFDPGEPIANQQVIIRVQEALARLGFDAGTPDGLIGPKTRDAIRAFERGTGMTESGGINPRLLAVLGSQPV